MGNRPADFNPWTIIYPRPHQQQQHGRLAYTYFDSIYALAVCVYVYNLIYISIGCRLNFFFFFFLPSCNSTATRTTAIVYPPIFGFSYYFFFIQDLYTNSLSPCITTATIRTTHTVSGGLEYKMRRFEISVFSFVSLPEVVDTPTEREGRFESMILNGSIREQKKI